MTPAEVEEAAQRWHDGQLARAERAHGVRWADHQEWTSAYVRAEVKERLIARGWRDTNEPR